MTVLSLQTFGRYFFIFIKLNICDIYLVLNSILFVCVLVFCACEINDMTALHLVSFSVLLCSAVIIKFICLFVLFLYFADVFVL